MIFMDEVDKIGCALLQDSQDRVMCRYRQQVEVELKNGSHQISSLMAPVSDNAV